MRFSQQRLEYWVRVIVVFLFIIFYLGLLTTDVAPSGQRQVPFLKPHLVTVTDTRPTSIKYVVNIFPKDITPWSGQDSNPGPSAPDPDALYTRPQRPLCIWKNEGINNGHLKDFNGNNPPKPHVIDSEMIEENFFLT